MEIDGVGVDIPPEDDDDRPLDADDWDGIFEVVGFIGPLTGLLHNVSWSPVAKLTLQHIFVSFSMALTLLVLVGLPIIIGKIVLSTDIIRLARDAFVGSTWIIAICVDAILDFLATIVTDFLTIPRLLAKSAVDWIVKSFGLPSLELNTFDQFNPFNLTSQLFGTPGNGSSLMAVNVTSELPPVVDAAAAKVLNAFELVGGASYGVYKTMRLVYICIAASPDAVDQFWCLLVGYVSVTIGIVCIAVADAANLLQLSDSFVEKARNVQVFMKVR
jgi:E3 ubiquitin-protein ligase MARCH6